MMGNLFGQGNGIGGAEREKRLWMKEGGYGFVALRPLGYLDVEISGEAQEF